MLGNSRAICIGRGGTRVIAPAGESHAAFARQVSVARARARNFPRVPIGRKVCRDVRHPFPFLHRGFNAVLAAARIFFS